MSSVANISSPTHRFTPGGVLTRRHQGKQRGGGDDGGNGGHSVDFADHVVERGVGDHGERVHGDLHDEVPVGPALLDVQVALRQTQTKESLVK